MTFRIFNPDHDIALAVNRDSYTPPHAGRQLRSELGFIPALWSKDGDVVIVDDIDMAGSTLRKLKNVRKPKVEFATFAQLEAILRDLSALETSSIAIDAWGWNKCLRRQFIEAGMPAEKLPSVEETEAIRDLSNRRASMDLLQNLRSVLGDKAVGESQYCTSVEQLLNTRSGNPIYHNCVVKAPWSSSGRGVRYLNDDMDGRGQQNFDNWLHNTIASQGGVMLEPYYNKVEDFGMEFFAEADGTIRYCGLSLFQTRNGAYTGNLLATEEAKRQLLERYISSETIDRTIATICEEYNCSPYVGPFGIDMMIVATDSGDKFLLHPCVEINLRRTMGHLALALSPTIADEKRLMSITFEGKHYHLKVTSL